MFPEYRDLITKLKGHDHHFTKIFDKHNTLDESIKKMEARVVLPAVEDEIEALKREKLKLKDELWAILRKAAAEDGKA